MPKAGRSIQAEPFPAQKMLSSCYRKLFFPIMQAPGTVYKPERACFLQQRGPAASCSAGEQPLRLRQPLWPLLHSKFFVQVVSLVCQDTCKMQGIFPNRQVAPPSFSWIFNEYNPYSSIHTIN